MCLILFAYRIHPCHELVLAANRDEFYHRPSAPMRFWRDAPDVLAGRDLLAGGTWLGLSRRGRFAALTNYRDPVTAKVDAPSRGALVSDFLTGAATGADYLAALASEADRYNGFNLLVGDSKGLYYYSNRNGSPRPLAPGIYGLSNHLLDTPWPKVVRGRRGLASALNGSNEPNIDALFALLMDRAIPDDRQLPDTGIGLVRERQLAPAFIKTTEYGTRSSSVLLLSDNGEGIAIEKNHVGDPALGLRRFVF